VRSKTRFVLVRVFKGWPGDEPAAERRQFRRFENGEIDARVALIGTDEGRLKLGECTLLDVSFAGMCLLTDEPLAMEGVYRFLIHFAAPFSEIVLVKARVAWMRPSDEGLRIGMRFLESSKGWLGPEAG
jgi:hypothetical protein